jgi:hypothetical protein
MLLMMMMMLLLPLLLLLPVTVSMQVFSLEYCAPEVA